MAFLATAFCSKAQTEAGKFVVGGDVEFSSAKNDGSFSSTRGLLLLPNAGYLIADNLAIGAGIGYQYSRYRQNTGSDVVNENPLSKNHGIIFNPYVRKYINIAEQFKFFAQLSGYYNRSKSKFESGNNYTINDYKVDVYGGQLAPGLVFFPTSKFGIDFALGGISYYYSRINYNDSPIGASIKSFSGSLNFTAPRVGVQYYFE